ncbi:hypothetical protein ACFVYA_06040 [Amycolatopsis sp. NPDC058278]|jgi:hypothetical protein|uniref:hypothetical protein n=1 Tax=unclassified Amycolatopsis TaxID=2618356 RepID=UPI00255C246D|nr:hypothetical protein [Amycolatopsis sp. DG1A-15b]WIX88185.1 hypothetical protein QRY02_44890 [Amycolatopsis sp. DG1A-15b]
MADENLLESDLLDVTDLDLEALQALPDCVLRCSLERALGAGEDSPGRYDAPYKAGL